MHCPATVADRWSATVADRWSDVLLAVFCHQNISLERDHAGSTALLLDTLVSGGEIHPTIGALGLVGVLHIGDIGGPTFDVHVITADFVDEVCGGPHACKWQQLSVLGGVGRGGKWGGDATHRCTSRHQGWLRLSQPRRSSRTGLQHPRLVRLKDSRSHHSRASRSEITRGLPEILVVAPHLFAAVSLFEFGAHCNSGRCQIPAFVCLRSERGGNTPRCVSSWLHLKSSYLRARTKRERRPNR